MGGCFRIFDWCYLALDANPTSHFWLKFYFWKLDCNPGLSEPLIGILAYLEPKLWLKKTCKNSTPTNGNHGYICTNGHNSSVDWARELFKPSEAEENRVVPNRTKLLFWISGLLLMFTWWECVYAYFVYISITSSFSVTRENEPISWLKFLLDSRL